LQRLRVISILILISISSFGFAPVTAAGAQVELFYAAGKPQVEFASNEIRAALTERGDACLPHSLDALGTPGKAAAVDPTRIVLASSAEESRHVAETLGVDPLKTAAVAQSYAIRRQSDTGRITYTVLAADPVGAMYGGLDLAEAVRLGTLANLTDSNHTPFIAQRGIKFNIPLDARTPSYSDASDSAQQNIAEVWDMGFWHEYLDELARQRFNVLSLWNLHPFPSMVKVPEYPDVALADVMRTTEKFDSSYARWITDLRTVVTDAVAQRHLVDEVYAQTGQNSTASAAITEFYSTNSPFDLLSKQTVDASVESIVQQSPKTYEVAWTEVTRDLSGALVARHRYRAFVSVVTQEVTDAKQALVNPLGLYVTNLTWGEVVTTSSDNQTANGGLNK
jgi:hypothetical protein